MNVALIAEMAAEAGGDRVVLGDVDTGTAYIELWDSARRAGSWLAGRNDGNVAMIGVNSPLFPVALFGAALADRSFAPLNYRWTDAELLAALRRLAPVTVIVDDSMLPRLHELSDLDVEVIGRSAFLYAVGQSEPIAVTGEMPRRPAVLLFTSGTSGTPKMAVLDHSHLTSYILGTVELMAAEEGDAQLSCLPPYHVGGIANLLSTLYSGRRIVQLEAFDPVAWIEAVRSQRVTHAMVVPTMLARIVAVLAEDGEVAALPTLRHLSYGGGRMPLPVVEQAMMLLPETGFANGYGLTETSSSITVLSPDDHRAAATSDDPSVRARLGSVGRPLPTVEVSVRDPEDGSVRAAGESGELWVRGEQVSGRYDGVGSLQDDGGWFRTKDSAHIDDDGYVFVEGRLDDVIVRGGENISPGEVEDALISHSDVADAGVTGLPDDDWGERVVAAVVAAPGRTPDPEALKEWVRTRLRSAKSPSMVQVVLELPYNDNGKLVRRVLRDQLSRSVHV
ncbi:class I adenylate-forming enzyme family protein [Mycolicibacterium hodleri]|uniref:Long-chain fatty acid--CoA ligase n=1 Tax=Mycolicibacterium hodleri TaxID=49897 RepID=A0A502E3Z4_9MYCO|nr:class I adenylate-forming enzyme family protein [Mycolicibacterium hodleri]TPG32458.1 long-chain fatty acid--CoA ligase [Mycolicibacterium hodleri]